jgi:hypothetical protein
MIWLIAGLIFAAGCIGGFVNSVVAGELKLPYHDEDARIYRPGWIGTVIVGGVASAASWGLYGPVAELTLIGPVTSVAEPTLRVAEFFGAILIGFGGGRWLTAELDRLIASRERDGLEQTKNILVDALKKVSAQ